MKTSCTFQLIIALVLCFAGLILLFLGFFFSPTGEIHHSVLIGFGEVSTFAGALFGVDYSYRRKPKDGLLPPSPSPSPGMDGAAGGALLLLLFFFLPSCSARKASQRQAYESLQSVAFHADSSHTKLLSAEWKNLTISLRHITLSPPDSLRRQSPQSITLLTASAAAHQETATHTATASASQEITRGEAIAITETQPVPASAFSLIYSLFLLTTLALFLPKLFPKK
jgi:hypothetical protein